RPLIAILQDRFELFAPDLRGFGDTTKPYSGPTEEMTSGVLADDLSTFLDAVDVHRPVGLVAHDVGAIVAQVFARRSPERLSGLFFFNCPYPGIGSRWITPEHVSEIWYQTFNCMPWSAAMVGASRETCRLYIGHILRHWAADEHAFDKDLERFVDNFMKPGNLQGGFNWYLGNRAARRAVWRGQLPDLPPIQVPTRVFWGERDPVLKAEWMDRLPETFATLRATVAEGVGHFVHYEAPDRAAHEIAMFFR
ncbi:MAG TPA: alpha/beta hydrolase, partial [Gemmatimonadales bacterium]|nr:alpha/beta hydrolase [Gemmatimonadales bacterium]